MHLEKISNFCGWYFGVNEKKKADTHSRFTHVMRVASYFFIAPPLIIGSIYGITALMNHCFKRKKGDPRVNDVMKRVLPPPRQVDFTSPQQQSTPSLSNPDGGNNKPLTLEAFKAEFRNLQVSIDKTSFEKCKQLCKKTPPVVLCEAMRDKDGTRGVAGDYISIIASYVDETKLTEMVKSEIDHSTKVNDFLLLAFFLTNYVILFNLGNYQRDLTIFCESSKNVEGLISVLQALKQDESQKVPVSALASRLDKMFPDAGFSTLFAYS